MEGKIGSWICVVVAITTWVKILEPTYCDAADLTLVVGKGNSKESYLKLLNDVRDKVKDPKLNYGFQNDLPVVATKPKSPQYLYIDIKADGGTITAGLSKKDLYLVGYVDNIGGTKKYHYFQDTTADAKKSAFPEVKDAKNRVEMKFKGSYIDLEKKAGDRSKIGLGVAPLNKYINKLYEDKELSVKSEAEFMLVVIQTIAEATRFKYIENNILNKFNDAFNPDVKAKVLEKNWETTSKTIKSSTSPKIDLELKDDNGKVVWKWYQVGELVDVMGILKNLEENSLNLQLFAPSHLSI